MLLIKSETFEKLLPYAIVLGVEKEWQNNLRVCM
jgi:hypothetical protein